MEQKPAKKRKTEQVEPTEEVESDLHSFESHGLRVDTSLVLSKGGYGVATVIALNTNMVSVTTSMEIKELPKTEFFIKFTFIGENHASRPLGEWVKISIAPENGTELLESSIDEKNNGYGPMYTKSYSLCFSTSTKTRAKKCQLIQWTICYHHCPPYSTATKHLRSFEYNA